MQPQSLAALLAQGDAGTRAAVAMALQRGGGNAVVQRLADGEVDAALDKEDVASRILAAEGRGRSLDPDVRDQFERLWGIDLTGVRLHADAQADSLAREVEAVAFTSGQDVYFRSGAYDAASAEGLHLLAHELAHTIQQAAGPVDGSETAEGIHVSAPDDAFEREADAVAREADAELAGLPRSASPSRPAAAARDSSEAQPLPAVQRVLGEEVLLPTLEALAESYIFQAGATGLTSAQAALAAPALPAELVGVAETLAVVGGGGAGEAALGTAATIPAGGGAAAGSGGLLASLGPAALVAGAGLAGFGVGTAIGEYGIDPYLNRAHTEEIDEEESIAAFGAQQRGETTWQQDVNDWFDDW